MKKIQVPVCDCCERSAQAYESTIWPGLGLCFQCWRVLAKWFVTNDLADSNPLAQELLGGVWAQIPRDGFYEVVFESDIGSNSSSHRHIRLIDNPEK